MLRYEIKKYIYKYKINWPFLTHDTKYINIK